MGLDNIRNILEKFFIFIKEEEVSNDNLSWVLIINKKLKEKKFFYIFIYSLE